MVKRGKNIKVEPEKEHLAPVWGDDYGDYHAKKYHWICEVCNKEYVARRDATNCERIHKRNSGQCKDCIWIKSCVNWNLNNDCNRIKYRR